MRDAATALFVLALLAVLGVPALAKGDASEVPVIPDEIWESLAGSTGLLDADTRALGYGLPGRRISRDRLRG